MYGALRDGFDEAFWMLLSWWHSQQTARNPYHLYLSSRCGVVCEPQWGLKFHCIFTSYRHDFRPLLTAMLAVSAEINGVGGLFAMVL